MIKKKKVIRAWVAGKLYSSGSYIYSFSNVLSCVKSLTTLIQGYVMVWKRDALGCWGLTPAVPLSCLAACGESPFNVLCLNTPCPLPTETLYALSPTLGKMGFCLG